MSSVDTIFRREALEFQASGRARGSGVVRLGGRWLRLLYWLTLALVIAGGTALWVLRADERATGPAIVDFPNGSVVALLPSVVGPQLPRTEGLSVTLPSGRSVRVHVVAAQPADASSIRRAGLGAAEGSGVLLRGQLQEVGNASATASGRIRARAVVVLRSERVVDVLTRQFRVVLGERGAQ